MWIEYVKGSCTLSDSEKEQSKSIETKNLKININVLIIEITERYSVKYTRHRIIDNTVLKIRLLEIQDLNSVSSS